MYKSTSRNMQSRAYRSSKAGAKKTLFNVRIGKSKRSGGPKRDKRQNQNTELELVDQLGPGPHFAWSVYRRYRHHLCKYDHEPKKCSAFLNIVARVRMIDGGLWTDKAVESMLRRALPKGK